MKPLKGWDNLRHGYTFGVKTFYNNFHMGVDHIVGCGTAIYMPFTGRVLKTFGTQGGNTLFIYPDGKQESIRILHCEWVTESGRYDRGSIVAKVGSTGLSTGCHTHTDIHSSGRLELGNNSNLIDPLKYNWEDEMIPFEELRDRTFTHEGKGLLWVKGEWIGNYLPKNWSAEVKALPNAIEVREVERIVEKVKIEYQDSPVLLEVIESLEKELQLALDLTPEEEQEIAYGWFRKLLGGIWDAIFKGKE